MLPEPLRVVFHSVVESDFVMSLTASAHMIFEILGIPQVVRAIVFGLGLGFELWLRLGLGLGLTFGLGLGLGCSVITLIYVYIPRTLTVFLC